MAGKGSSPAETAWHATRGHASTRCQGRGDKSTLSVCDKTKTGPRPAAGRGQADRSQRLILPLALAQADQASHQIELALLEGAGHAAYVASWANNQIYGNQTSSISIAITERSCASQVLSRTYNGLHRTAPLWVSSTLPRGQSCLSG